MAIALFPRRRVLSGPAPGVGLGMQGPDGLAFGPLPSSAGRFQGAGHEETRGGSRLSGNGGVWRAGEGAGEGQSAVTRRVSAQGRDACLFALALSCCRFLRSWPF